MYNISMELTSEQLDQAVVDYFKKNPNGNHPDPAPETLRFMDEQIKINKQTVDTLTDIKVIQAQQNVLIVEGFKKTHEKQDYTNGNVNDLLDWKEKREPLLDKLCKKEEEIYDRWKNWKDRALVAGIVGSLTLLISNLQEALDIFQRIF